MIILGVDTSLRSSGYGVLETSGNRLCALTYGRIPNGQKEPISTCLTKIHATIAELIAVWHPDVLSVEKVIYGKNANTVLSRGENRV